jgi:hypothetical protein
VSRPRRQLRLEARERWPLLSNFFGCYLHEDYRIFHGSPEAAVDAAVAEHSLEQRQAILKEWRDWNARRGWQEDVHRFMWDGFAVYYTFDSAPEARQFMNMVYEKLITSVRAETERRWKP